IAILQEAVVRHLHRDRAEALTDAARAEITQNRAEDAAPVEAVVVVEAAILGGDESVAYLLRHCGNRYVDAAHILEVTEEPARPVIHVAAFARMEGADLGGARASVKTHSPPANRQTHHTQHS